MKQNTLLVILAIAAVGGISTSLVAVEASNEVPTNEQSYETTVHELTLDDLRSMSLAEGEIFNEYLIPFSMSQTLVDAYGGLDQAQSSYEHLTELLKESKDDPYLNLVNGFLVLSSNFGIMTNTVIHSDKIATLVIHEQKQAGEYEMPDLVPLQKVHAYLESEYPVGATDPTLQDMFGDMTVLAPRILEMVEIKALLGKSPHEIRDTDPYYWAAVGDYGRCDMLGEGTDCTSHLDKAKARAWEQPPKQEQGFFD